MRSMGSGVQDMSGESYIIPGPEPGPSRHPGGRLGLLLSWIAPAAGPEPGEAAMPTVEHLKIEPQAGYRSQEVALLIALLDDQSALLAKDIADITPDELQWQAKPGMNTIGMLLAHMPIVEVYW